MQTMRHLKNDEGGSTRRRTTIRATLGVTLAVALGAVGLLAAGALAGNAAQSSATISLRSTKLGSILVNSKGHTLYLFGKDRGGKSSCSGQCAQFWPPLVARGKPTVGKGLKASLVRVTKRSDGKLQVSYNRHPLYTFSLDKRAGQTKGQNYSDGPANFWGNYDKISTPDEIAPQTAQLFLGVRLHCAQCHNHPFEKWTQHDFQGRRAGLLGQGVLGALDDGGRAGIRFEAAPTPAAALPRFGHLDLHVADFGAVTVLAFEHHVADDDSAAHAGAERE